MADEQKVFTVLGYPEVANGPFMFSCEHASNSIGFMQATPAEAEILSSHWGWDIGAAAVVDALVQRTDSVGVLCNRSRLLLDVNRRPESETLIKTHVEGHELSFNKGLRVGDHQDRIHRLHRGFHEGLGQAFSTRARRGTSNLVSIHSFTPRWQGENRWMEIGVLFDRYDTEAKTLGDALESEGFAVALNEPYSGLGGELMYSATRHGSEQGVPYLELEIRQDLIGSDSAIQVVAQRIANALKVFEPVRT